MDKGSQVAIEYTLFLEDGSEVDTNVGGELLVYEAGASQILPALEQALDELGAGEGKRVTLSPDDAYGQVNDDAFQEVPHDAVPEEAREVGTMLAFNDEEGQPHPLRVHEVKEETIVLDFNHPLAGSTLVFEVKVVHIDPGA